MEGKPLLGRGDSPDKDSFYDKLIDTDAVVSATECTGLVQIPPQNEDEEESYNHIYQVFDETKKESKK